MNGQEFHLLDVTIDLPDPFKINSDFRNCDVNPLFLRVGLAAREYFQATVCEGLDAGG